MLLSCQCFSSTEISVRRWAVVTLSPDIFSVLKGETEAQYRPFQILLELFRSPVLLEVKDIHYGFVSS